MHGTPSILPARLRMRCLSIEAPDPRLGRALEASILAADAVTRAARANAAPRSETIAAADLGWLGIAATAVGARDAARSALDAVAAAVATSPAPADARLYMLLVARYLAWTGEVPYIASAHWPRVRQLAGELPPSGVYRIGGAPTTPDREAAAALAAELAAAAEAVGDASWPRAPRPTPETSRADVDPLTGLPGAPAADAWRELSRGDVESGIRALVEDAARAWRPLLGVGTQGVPDPSAIPLDAMATGVSARAATAVALALVHGLLGAEPDATRHRLVLRPRFPATWSGCRVERITLGDAELELRFARDDSGFEFTVEQVAGAVPIRLIFEPTLPVSEPLAVLIDDDPAELDWRPRGGRQVAPVQLVLDHLRRVRFDADTPPA